MTQQEFTARTGYEPTYDEFWRIHDEYMSTNYDKDEFCKRWRRNNLWRIKQGTEHHFSTIQETERFVLKCIQNGVTFQSIGIKCIRTFE